MKKQWMVIAIAAVVGVVLGHELMAQTSDVAGAATQLKVESRTTLFDLIKSGGWAMWALGTCSVVVVWLIIINFQRVNSCLLYTSPSPRDRQKSRMPSSA